MFYLKIYLFIAILSFILNGVIYNVALFRHNQEESFLEALRVGLLFIVISLLWPAQLVYFAKLLKEGK